MKWKLLVALGVVVLAGTLSLRLSPAGAFGRLPVARPIEVNEAFRRLRDTLHRDQAVASVLVRRGIPSQQVPVVLGAATGLDPRRARVGQGFAFRYVIGDSVPDLIVTRINRDSVLHLSRTGNRWIGRIETILWQVEQERAEGVMKTSLYESIHDVIPDNVLPRFERERLIADLADKVFGWEIDFSHDIVKGDRFSLVYERLSSSLHDVRYGRVVAARIETRHRPNNAFLLPDDAGGPNTYFDENGISLQRSFLKKPVAFLHIASGFSNRRFHPVLGIYRAHQGTDFAAHMGTEIHATGDGTVRLAGWNGAYGYMVAIRHPNNIETRYAHMSRVRAGIHPGVRVKQDEVIGYVGATGLATGPHVHYEFLNNGKQVDALKVKMDQGAPLPISRRQEFTTLKHSYESLLETPVPQSVAVSRN